MELNIKKAFLAPFSDEKWYIKLIFPSIMAIFSLIFNVLIHVKPKESIILYLIVLIPSLILSGFFLQFAHNEIHDEKPLLPNLKSNIKTYLVNGIKYLGLTLLYALVIGFTLGLVVILLNIIIGIIVGFCAISFHLDKPTFTMLAAIISVITYIPFAIFMFAYFILICGAFSDKFSFKEAKDFKRIFKLLKQAKSEVAVCILLEIGIFITAIIAILILLLPKITLVFAPIIVAIGQMISVNLKAQVYKIAKSRLEVQVEPA